MKLYFIRHGQTEANERGILTGRIETNLSQKGIDDTVALSKTLKEDSDYYICSPLKRTHQTLKILKGDVDFSVDERMIEVYSGDWQGKLKTEVPQEEYSLYKKGELDPPGGEALTDVDRRIISFLDDMFSKYKANEKILVVTHNALMRNLKRLFIDKDKVDEPKNLEIFVVDDEMYQKLKNGIYEKAIGEARELMHEQTIKNGAPSWLLTELAQEVGEELANKYKVDKNIVLLALYLQHLVFDPAVSGEIQKNHPELSAKYVEEKNLLEKWSIPSEDRRIILGAIKLHHDREKSKNLIVEVIKNAECQKFVTVKGALIWLHELGLRGYSFDEAEKLVFYKMNQKKALLTLDECAREGEISCKKIAEMFEDGETRQKLVKLHSLGLEKVDFERAVVLARL